ncbi:hypothetical protein AOLI_G00053500 [Acnodon oligacanthus]
MFWFRLCAKNPRLLQTQPGHWRELGSPELISSQPQSPRGNEGQVSWWIQADSTLGPDLQPTPISLCLVDDCHQVGCGPLGPYPEPHCHAHSTRSIQTEPGLRRTPAARP